MVSDVEGGPLASSASSVNEYELCLQRVLERVPWRPSRRCKILPPPPLVSNECLVQQTRPFGSSFLGT